MLFAPPYFLSLGTFQSGQRFLLCKALRQGFLILIRTGVDGYRVDETRNYPFYSPDQMDREARRDRTRGHVFYSDGVHPGETQHGLGAEFVVLQSFRTMRSRLGTHAGTSHRFTNYDRSAEMFLSRTIYTELLKLSIPQGCGKR